MNDRAIPVQNGSVGTTTAAFAPVRRQFDADLLRDVHYSAQLCVYWNGDRVVDLAGGPHLKLDSVTGIFSATKGVSAVALATLVQDRKLDVDARVVDYWPEFATNGKQDVLVSELLSHQVGLLNVDGGLTTDDYADSTAAAERLAAARPQWRPGSAFGYHGLTIGIFIEELVRRVTGDSLQSLFERVVRAPRNIDCWLGLPDTEDHRYRPLLPIEHTPDTAMDAAHTAMAGDALRAFAFGRFRTSPDPVPDIGAADDDSVANLMTNNVAIRRSGFSSTAGVASARGLAQVYSAALGHLGEPLFDDATRDRFSQQQVWGIDRLSATLRAFGVVFMKPVPGIEFGSFKAFGHDGANGRLAFADPSYGLSFGYIPSPMQHVSFGIGADERSVRLSEIARRCVAAQIQA